MTPIPTIKDPLPDCQFIDVREPFEFASQSIPGTQNIPLSELSNNIANLEKERTLVVVCQSGQRAHIAARRLTDCGFRDVRVLEGGIDGWKAKNKPMMACSTSVWGLERQVRFSAGLLVLMGLVGAWQLHTYFIAITVFVGCGLVFSAVTNTCGLAFILKKMPWNQVR